MFIYHYSLLLSVMPSLCVLYYVYLTLFLSLYLFVLLLYSITLPYYISNNLRLSTFILVIQFEYSQKSELEEVSLLGSGCGTVGRVVASNTRGLWFECSHWQNLYWIFVYLFTISCIENTKINKKRPRMAHFFKKEIYLQNFPPCRL